MGKQSDFVRLEARLPKDDHGALRKQCDVLRVPLNAAFVALVKAFLRGEVVIEKVKPIHPYVARPANVRTVMEGRIAAKGQPVK